MHQDTSEVHAGGRQEHNGHTSNQQGTEDDGQTPYQQSDGHEDHTSDRQGIEHDGNTLNQQQDGHTSEQHEVDNNGHTSDQFAGNIGSSSSGSNPTRAAKPFVLPSHLRRSARASRSKYRHPTENTTTSNADMDTSNVHVENEAVTRVDQYVRQFTKLAKRMHNPASCRPRPGEPPLVLYWWNGVPVGPNAVKFGDYCGEEAKRYDRYPLHRRWNPRQTEYACQLYKTALVKKHYIHIGEEDPEHEGETLPVDQRAAEKFIYLAVQDQKKDWRHTVKKEYFLPWEEADDDETRSAILEGLDPRIPKDKWPMLCAYYSSPEKKAEAESNSQNRRSTNNLRPVCTTGRKRLMNVYYALKKVHGHQFRIPKAFVHGHTRRGTENKYPDEKTKQYCEKMDDLSQNIPLESQQSLSTLPSLTDATSGRHHGGYERGVGRAYSRKLHKVVEKLPMLRTPLSRQESEELVTLRNTVADLQRREREREKQQAAFNERFSLATGQTVDISVLASMMTQLAAQMGLAFTGMTNIMTTPEPNGRRSRGNAGSRSRDNNGSSSRRPNDGEERRGSNS